MNNYDPHRALLDLIYARAKEAAARRREAVVAEAERIVNRDA